ncbi:MAG: acyltransferase [Chloroflexi bacterium]|nr:MAG: acyltransferase [Chloroflexota bacterium]
MVEINEQAVNKTPLSEQLSSSGGSALDRYRQKAAGDMSVMRLLQYELGMTLFSNMAGGAGYLLRKWFISSLFGEVGSGLILGRGVTLRHPGKMAIGKNVAIDDYVMIDASGAGENGVRINDQVIVSRNCVVQGKTGYVHIGKKADIGCNTMITSATGISIGKYVLIGGNCYIGGGRYFADKLDVPMMMQGVFSKGPVIIEDDVWLGANVTVLDGVRIGKGSIIGAGAVVTKDIPDYKIAVGMPARVIGDRQAK